MSENMKTIKALEDKYGIVLFGMALTHLVDVGARHLTDLDFDKIEKKLRAKNAESGCPLLSVEFQMEVLRCAAELAKYEIWDLFYYIKNYLKIEERSIEDV